MDDTNDTGKPSEYGPSLAARLMPWVGYCEKNEVRLDEVLVTLEPDAWRRLLYPRPAFSENLDGKTVPEAIAILQGYCRPAPTVP